MRLACLPQRAPAVRWSLRWALLALAAGGSLLAEAPPHPRVGTPTGQSSSQTSAQASADRAPQGGGASTAGVFATVRDRESRPITAGGFVEGAPVVFDDRTRGSGLDAFTHVSGAPEKRVILESPSGGVALVDVDGDGWLDVYLLNGSTFDAAGAGRATRAPSAETSATRPFPSPRARGEGRGEGPPRAMLLRNNRDLTFTDITARAGVANERWGFGVAAGDVDNDGRVDLYVTNFGRNRLYRNNGDGTFTDIAERMGVAGDGGWSTGATFGDYDRDGRLDLFVAGYVAVDPSQPDAAPRPDDAPRDEDRKRIQGNAAADTAAARGATTAATPPTRAAAMAATSATAPAAAAASTSGARPVGRLSCRYRGEPVMCGPRGLPGAPDRLYHNEGGRFVDVTAKAGVTDTAGYYGFAAAWIDADDDGWPDLMVVNDSTPNYLYRNKGDGTFEEIGFPAGFALNEEGRDQAGMGLAIGDYDNDGDIDTYITNFSDDSNTLRRNDGRGAFTDVTAAAGLRTPTLPFLGWGTGFLDVENDGWLDLFVANGHVYPQVDNFDWGMTWAQRPLLFRNRGRDRRFEEVPAAPGSGLAVVVPARGAAFGDLDHDGRVDIVLNNHDRPPTLLRNVAASAGHWIAFRVVRKDAAAPATASGGRPDGSTRDAAGTATPASTGSDAIGAVVTVTAGAQRWRRDVISGGSYCSQSDLRVHVGLGNVTTLETVTVRWPDGRRERFEAPQVDRVVTLVEGRGKASP